ncbi:MAG: hypothetical protein ACE5IB_03355, partial [Candidatus Geothermarchaeales archaeon]
SKGNPFHLEGRALARDLNVTPLFTIDPVLGSLAFATAVPPPLRSVPRLGRRSQTTGRSPEIRIGRGLKA